MKVILSNAPTALLRYFGQKGQAQNWLYLGTNRDTLERLGIIFGIQGNVCPDGRLLYDMSQWLRSKFVRWIDSISLSDQAKEEWLFSTPSVKNTYSSNLFLYICYFFLFKKIYDEKKLAIDWVVIESPALCLILKQAFPKDIIFPKVNLALISLVQAKYFLRSIWRLARYFLVDVGPRLIAARRILRGRIEGLLSRKKNIVLIRQYISKDYDHSKDNIFRKHYFQELDEVLEEHGYSPVYLPITAEVHQYSSLFQKIIKSRVPIVIAEEVLRLSDYLYVALSSFRALGSCPDSPPLEGFEFRSLLREEYFANITDQGTLAASAMSRVGRRFREKNIPIVGVINWWENQAQEKGLIHGFRQTYPTIKIIGSQPFFPASNELFLFPSKQDRLLKVSADEVIVLGLVSRKAVTEFDPDLKVHYGPHFKYPIYRRGSLSRNERGDLIILIGYDLGNALQMLNLVHRAERDLPSFRKILIKLHPATRFNSRVLQEKTGRKFPDHYEFVSGDKVNIDQINYGICGATGGGIDLVMRGIPIAIVGNSQSLTMNFLWYREDSDLWRLCFSVEDLLEACNDFHQLSSKQRSLLQQKGDEFSNAYLASEGVGNWRKFLVETT